MTEDDYARAAVLAEAIRTAERNPRNHIVVRQLAIALEPHISEAHEAHGDLAPLFERLRAGGWPTAIEVEGLLRVAAAEERYLRTGKE
jgi:hypothetical protein